MRPLALLLALVLVPAVAESRPAAVPNLPDIEDASIGTGDGSRPALSGRLPGLSSTLFTDTIYYGGTYWAADSLRWEALADSVWTFDSGVGSAFGPTPPSKPAGYHTLMEGWFGIDQTRNELPYFRRSDTCAISGTYSFWAGITENEARPLCWAAGQGYGNGWELIVQKQFFYPGSGSVTLSLDYATDCETNFDHFIVAVDTLGEEADRYQDYLELASFTGVTSGTFTTTLTRGVTLPMGPKAFTVNFVFDSDGSYSDEDGLYDSSCGGAVVDNVQLSGAVIDASTFENGSQGWTQIYLNPYLSGDFSHLVDRGTLPPSLAFCPCGIRDSVLVFYDETGEHTFRQDNIAVSPWIDLKRHNDLGRAGRVISYDVYADIPLSNYIYAQLRSRWYPYLCPANGTIIISPFRDENVIYTYGELPFCTRPGAPRIRDYSGVIPPEAEQVQIAVGILSLCAAIIEPPFPPCDGVSNTTPWFDNIRLGIYGPQEAPIVRITTADFLQDNFAENGTLNPASTGRMDVNRLKNTSTPGPSSILGDTLVARAASTNTEVRLVFRVRPGPFTSQLALAVWTYQWTPEPAIGAGWYSARMDTAEQGGVVHPGLWMTTFHEDDPGFSGTDRSPDPHDTWQLENEILPDRILTPGARVDYFVASRYIPPDPRNPTGTAWYVVPDTTGGRYAEAEILPSSMAADTTWNAVLYVDHHQGLWTEIEEGSLDAAIGTGGANAEGTGHDRYDALGSQVSFGRPAGARHAASLDQAYAYQTIVWLSGSFSVAELSVQDAAVLSPWLTMPCQGPGCPPYPHRAFWGSGDGLATSMNANATVRSFMENVLGVLRTCDTARDPNCPNPSSLDSTFCLPVSETTGAAFPVTTLTNLRGNGCPDLRSFDVLAPNPAMASARGQLEYLKAGFAVGLASVTNQSPSTCARSVLDGFALGVARTRPAEPHLPGQCGDPGAAYSRASDVLAWFASPCQISAVDDPAGGDGPAYRTQLQAARPNPMSLSTRIAFTAGSGAGPIRLEIFDVTGRLVRRLVDSRLAPGPAEITWDGTSETGSRVAGGLYFYRLTDGSGPGVAKKLIVLH